MGEAFEQQVATLLSQIPSIKKEVVEAHVEDAASFHALNEETDDVENINADERTEPQAIVESLLGDSWQGDAAVFTDESGVAYLAHKGSWVSSSGSFVEGAGVIKLKDLETYNGFKSPQNGEVNVTFLPEASSLRIDTVENGNHFTQTQSVESFFKEAILGVDFGLSGRSGIRTINIRMNTFIAAKVLDLLSSFTSIPGTGLWEGDDRGFGDSGTSRTSQNIKIAFENNQATVVDEFHATGMTYKLNKEGSLKDFGKASGNTLKYVFQKEFSSEYNRDVYKLHLEGDEKLAITMEGGPCSRSL